MPAVETVLNKPLSGEEVKQIIINKLADKLRGDTRLSDFIAVPAFEFRLDLVMLLDGAVHNEINHTIEHKHGQVSATSNQLTAIDHHIEQKQMPPNQARVDAGLDVPVLSHDEKGRPVEKGVKYAKEQARGPKKGE